MKADIKYEEFCISPDLSVRDAMERIGNNALQIVFIVEGRKLIASLTDGDIRRFLLKGGQLSESAVKAGNREPRVANDRSEADALYDRCHMVAIPIVNRNAELTDIYFGPENFVVRNAPLNIPVIINAGGKGTRLEPYTKILPKPLIPVGDLPVIEHIMQRFMEYSCDRFSVIVNYKKEMMKAYFAESGRKYNIAWYEEDEPLGTGGGLCYLKGKIDSTFFFTNCDILLLSNYESILRFHRECKNVITMVCAYKNITIPYGVIDMGIDGVIEAMREKPELSFLTNTGIYLVEPEVLGDIEYNVPVGFPDIVDKERQMGRKVAIYTVSENDWLDMGQLSELEKMRKRLYGE